MEQTIKAEKLTKSYGNTNVVSNLSFSVNSGQILGLLGSNGAGKTTTIECILGTRKSDHGNISILGMNPILQRKRLFEKVGVQFQESNYPNRLLVYELCEETSCLYKSPRNYKELLKQFGLLEKLKSPITELSGGQKQKLFIALALIPDPDVVFLDELTTGLDPRARRDVWKSLIDLKKQGLTVLLTSHFMDEVENLCDEIIILKKGKTVFYGTVKEAISKSPCTKFEDAYLWYSEEEEQNESI